MRHESSELQKSEATGEYSGDPFCCTVIDMVRLMHPICASSGQYVGYFDISNSLIETESGMCLCVVL